MGNQLDEEAARRARWEKRKQEMRRQKQRQELFRKAAIPGIAVVFVLLVICIAIGIGKKAKNTGVEPEQTKKEEPALPTQAEVQIGQTVDSDSLILEHQESEEDEKIEAEDNVLLSEYKVTDDTIQLGSDIVSNYAVFIDMESGTIIARKGETTRIVPASMTKVLTLLVAVENIDNLDDTFEITSDITDYCLKNDCSNAGFEVGEVVTIKDLLYAAILPSGADGALGLAYYVAGSQEAFVELMNAKLKELGIAGTAHFTNCVGLYDDNHYCTV
ncbi:MAG: hypothetical protein K2J04_03665, partial [Lachnospiraceae bacterium]|nr:hypothetical protein [Lachnospiraceae bacterium]